MSEPVNSPRESQILVRCAHSAVAQASARPERCGKMKAILDLSDTNAAVLSSKWSSH